MGHMEAAKNVPIHRIGKFCQTPSSFSQIPVYLMTFNQSINNSAIVGYISPDSWFFGWSVGIL